MDPEERLQNLEMRLLAMRDIAIILGVAIGKAGPAMPKHIADGLQAMAQTARPKSALRAETIDLFAAQLESMLIAIPTDRQPTPPAPPSPSR